ncbi:hypothetical protein EDC96DRAFT_451557, partial [Choanephora cucurbitarum]
ASQRTLTLSENELLSHERLIDYTHLILPHQLPRLMDLNQFVAMEIVPLLLKSDPLYLEALVTAPITNSIRACDRLEDSPRKDRQVKQVARFIQSLLEKKMIPISDYVVEIQAFCVSYMKLKSVVDLFRLVSQH